MRNAIRFHKIYTSLIPNKTNRSGLDLANSRKYEFVNLLNVAFIFLQINLIIALASPAYFPGAHFATSK